MTEYALSLSDVEVARYRHMAESAQTSEAKQWAMAGIAAGATVADIGCGPGAMATLLAQLVGPSGQVWAVDQDAQAVATATALAATLGLDNVSCRVGGATETGLPAASVDVVVMRHVLAHNGGREQAIVDHLASLVRPGGHVYLVDVEYTAVRIRPPSPEAEDLSRRYWEFQTARGNDLSVGLRLGQLVTDAGLELVEHRGWYEIFAARPGFRPPSWAARDAMLAAGVATPDDVARWAAYFDELDQGHGSQTIFLPQFSAIGRRTQ